MITVKTVEKYRYEGKEYDSLQQVKVAVENKLGRVLDKLDGKILLNSKQKLAIFNTIIDNKESLVDCLTVSYDEEVDDSGLYVESKNILDLEG